MKRALTGLVVVLGLLALVSPGSADQCAFCATELEPGTNPLKCPHCIELAEKIARGNERVWVLEFQQGNLGRIQIKDDTGDTENYWFLPYTLKNKDEHPHEFFIDVTATSDKGNQEYRYHDMWIPDVFDEAAKILGVREGHPLLSQRELCMPPAGQQNTMPQISNPQVNESAKIALPTIQPGETLRCVALFQKIDPEMDRLTIKVRGLTSSSLLTHDAYVIPDSQPNRRIVNEAVLLLDYRRPGDEFAHGQDPIEFIGRHWADETRTIKSDLR
jgi:hypothetical protein